MQKGVGVALAASWKLQGHHCHLVHRDDVVRHRGLEGGL